MYVYMYRVDPIAYLLPQPSSPSAYLSTPTLVVQETGLGLTRKLKVNP